MHRPPLAPFALLALCALGLSLSFCAAAQVGGVICDDLRPFDGTHAECVARLANDPLLEGCASGPQVGTYLCLAPRPAPGGAGWAPGPRPVADPVAEFFVPFVTSWPEVAHAYVIWNPGACAVRYEFDFRGYYRDALPGLTAGPDVGGEIPAGEAVFVPARRLLANEARGRGPALLSVTGPQVRDGQIRVAVRTNRPGAGVQSSAWIPQARFVSHGPEKGCQ